MLHVMYLLVLHLLNATESLVMTSVLIYQSSGLPAYDIECFYMELPWLSRSGQPELFPVRRKKVVSTP
jgi:hypothetical protein